MESAVAKLLIVSHKSLIFRRLKSIVTAELCPICVQQYHVIAIPLGADFVVSERFGGVEVKYEKQDALFKHNDFILFVSQTHELVF